MTAVLLCLGAALGLGAFALLLGAMIRAGNPSQERPVHRGAPERGRIVDMET